MLGKLFAQEMRALVKPAAIMLAIMVVAGVVGIGCIEATDAVSRAAGFASRYVNEASAASNLTVVLVMAAQNFAVTSAPVRTGSVSVR